MTATATNVPATAPVFDRNPTSMTSPAWVIVSVGGEAVGVMTIVSTSPVMVTIDAYGVIYVVEDVAVVKTGVAFGA
jgi:hypothetical protein